MLSLIIRFYRYEDGGRYLLGTPTVHLWTRSKQPWIAIPEGDQIFETQPADLVRFFYQTG